MKKILILLMASILLAGCQKADTNEGNGKLNVVATTTMITDLVQHIGGEYVNVKGLMQAGVDPHLYQAKESDAATLTSADVVVYNGVHLEAKLADILERLDNTISLEDGLEPTDILDDDNLGRDPHIWFSVPLWKKAAHELAVRLGTFDEKNKDAYLNNYETYAKELDELQSYITKRVQEVPETQRVLVTAHDAFNYFAASNGFEVQAIQGISTESEASTSTISDLATFIVEHKIKAVFTESSISPKTIESLQKAVKAQGFEVTIGDELYSDSLKENATYIETYTLNVDAIVNALK